jgi:hypothetical protein
MSNGNEDQPNEERLTVCKECESEIREPVVGGPVARKHYRVQDRFSYYLSRSQSPHAYQTFLEVLQAAGVCATCMEHHEGYHAGGFRSRCLLCQLDRKRLNAKVSERLASPQSC